MVLQFQQPFTISPNQPNTTTQALGQLGDTFNNIGQEALQYRQQQIQNARQQQLLDIQKQQAAREEQANQPLDYFMNNYQSQGGQSMNVGPQGPMPSGGLEQGTTGPRPMPMATPNYQDMQGNQSVQGTTPGRHPDGTPFYQPGQNQPQNPIAQANGMGQRQNPMQGGFDMGLYSRLPGAQASRYAEGAKVASEFPGGMNSKFLNPAQTQDVMSGNFNPNNWPGGYVPSSEVSAAAMNKRFGSSQETKQDEYDRTEGAKIGNEINSLTTSGRNALGMAAKHKMALQTYQGILSDPKATNEELHGVIEGVNGILGAAPGVEYNTIASKWNSLQTYLTSNPQAINTPEIRNQVLRSISAISNISDSTIARNSRTVQAAHAAWIRKYPDQWSNMLSAINADQGNNASGQGGGTRDHPPQTRLGKDGKTYTYTWNGSKYE